MIMTWLIYDCDYEYDYDYDMMMMIPNSIMICMMIMVDLLGLNTCYVIWLVESVHV